MITYNQKKYAVRSLAQCENSGRTKSEETMKEEMIVRFSWSCFTASPDSFRDVFDLYLSPNFDSAIIIDFQPYRESTDSLLFTYEELLSILQDALSTSDSESRPRLPIFKIIDSQAHPAVTRNAPTYQSNMMPLEMIEFSEGRNMAEFKEAWDEAVRMGMTE